METQLTWQLTIVLLEGLRLIRPDKSWRPIITLEVDNHHIHETTLGVDGQCVNQKECFHFHDATPGTPIEVKVWHRSSSKKKKRRILVASASHSLGELLKKQDTGLDVSIRLQCRNADQKPTCSRGRPQKGAMLRIKLKPPSVPTPAHSEGDVRRSWSADDESSSSDDSSLHSLRGELHSERTQLLQPPSTIRRRIKGYAINTDDEIYSTDSECVPDIKRLDEDKSITCVGDGDEYFDDTLTIHAYPKDIIQLTTGPNGEIMASNVPLPMYTEKLTVPPDFIGPERFLASFTMYGELSVARTPEEFDSPIRRLQQEWGYNGAMLCALAAVNTAVFALSPDTIFAVNTYAKSAIALSSISSGVGIATDAWFLLRYNWIEPTTFITRARDVYGKYIFFSLSARVPTLCMFIASLSLMAFLGLVAFNTWPQAVLAFCFLVGVVMTLQFLVYGVHIAAKTVATGGRAGGRQVLRAVTVVRKMTT
ncbi:hypothetical protein CPB83DRAFT_886178 [Crepidotus variabilis]|uniref:C2 domain-containing protein n=1 Tax=Crepidotus variabilis TaxID=179855 RepID=A0A9P6E979_9AGAR|nr:hypothetical protein CPB83DRAFT_886178 [Crepidotus variabilis]